MNPLVSVIVPNYNHSRFLLKRLDSIYNQTYSNFEVILLDDNSLDNSIEILSSYKDHEFTSQLLINSENSGSTFLQWKKGIELAKGEYIWIAESDDIAEYNFIETLIKAFNKNQHLGIAYCQSYIIDENDNKLYHNKVWTSDLDARRWENNFINNGIDECTNYLVYKNTIPNASAVIFKKSFISSFPADYKLAGDWFFWISILVNSNIYYNASALNYFRKHDSTTRKHNTHDKKMLRINEGLKVIELLKNHLNSNTFNERITFHYKWFLKTLPFKKLIVNILKPYNSFVIKYNYIKIVWLSIKETFNRLLK